MQGTFLQATPTPIPKYVLDIPGGCDASDAPALTLSPVQVNARTLSTLRLAGEMLGEVDLQPPRTIQQSMRATAGRVSSGGGRSLSDINEPSKQNPPCLERQGGFE